MSLQWFQFRAQPGGGLELTNDEAALSASTVYQVALSRSVLAEFGGAFRHDRERQTQARPQHDVGRPSSTARQDDLQFTDLGVHAGFELSVAADFRLMADARLERLDAVTDARSSGVDRGGRIGGWTLAPRIRFEWNPSDPTTFFGSYGHGRRSPEALLSGRGEGSELGLVHSGEVGARITLDGLQASVAGFSTRTDGSPSSGPEVLTGASIVLEAAPIGSANLLGSLTFTHATLDGQPAPSVPAWLARFEVDDQQALGTWMDWPAEVFGNVGVSVMSARVGPSGGRRPPIGLLDAAIGLEWGPMAVSIEGSNLLDVGFEDGEFAYATDFDDADSASALWSRALTPGDPLTVQAMLSIEL